MHYAVELKHWTLSCPIAGAPETAAVDGHALQPIGWDLRPKWEQCGDEKAKHCRIHSPLAAVCGPSVGAGSSHAVTTMRSMILGF